MGGTVPVQQLPLRRVPRAADGSFRKGHEIRPEPARLYRLPPNRNAAVESKDTRTRRHRLQCADDYDDGARDESGYGQEI